MAMAHGNLCRHGWVPSQPLLVIVSPFHPLPLPSPSSPLSSPSSFPPLYFSVLPLRLFWLPTTLTPSHQHHHHHSPLPPHFSFSLQGSSGHCSPSTPDAPPSQHHHLLFLPPPQPLFLSERMFQPLHTDSSGILCVEMFLLDPQALTIYRTKARAPLLKAWHLWPPARASDLSPWLISPLHPLPSALRYGCAAAKGVVSDTTLTVVKVNAMQYMLWPVNNTPWK